MSALQELLEVTQQPGVDPGLPAVEVRGHQAIITLNRPDHRNRLSPVDIKRITEALDVLEQEPDIRSIVFTGRGEVFCSGFNLNVFYDNLVVDKAGRQREVKAEDNFFGDFTQRVEDCSLPTILAANGPVYGGGTDVA
ncbi:MAG: enoyl-CoA hydratase/isomerase family protein, partial [Pseudomonadota bacterium]